MVPWLTTCTVGWSPPAPDALFTAADPAHPTPGPPPPPQFGCGPVMTGWVTASSAANHSSCDSCTTVPGLTGSTHAKSLGLPAYLIWSHSTVCCVDTEKAIRWSVTTVLSCGAGLWKHPPQARACGSPATVIAATAATASRDETSVALMVAEDLPVSSASRP